MVKGLFPWLPDPLYNSHRCVTVGNASASVRDDECNASVHVLSGSRIDGSSPSSHALQSSPITDSRRGEACPGRPGQLLPAAYLPGGVERSFLAGCSEGQGIDKVLSQSCVRYANGASRSDCGVACRSAPFGLNVSRKSDAMRKGTNCRLWGRTSTYLLSENNQLISK